MIGLHVTLMFLFVQNLKFDRIYIARLDSSNKI